uniref:GH01976p n=1 Tax=Drosophila melanogaster TaxID=7227 RepID=Q8SZV4_DROME|nr:GH01976p [Drosophila melanogaster]
MPLQMYNYTYIINNKFHSADKRHIFKKSVQLVFIRPRTRVKYYFLILKIIAFYLDSFVLRFLSIKNITNLFQSPYYNEHSKLSQLMLRGKRKSIKNQLQIIVLYLDKLYTMINGGSD